MKLFSVYMGKTKIEFSVVAVHGGYQAQINGMVMFESPDYELVRATLMDSLEINVSYAGGLH